MKLSASGRRAKGTRINAAKDVEGQFLIYQGVEQGGAWSAFVNTRTGSLTVTKAAAEQDAFAA